MKEQRKGFSPASGMASTKVRPWGGKEGKACYGLGKSRGLEPKVQYLGLLRRSCRSGTPTTVASQVQRLLALGSAARQGGRGVLLVVVSDGNDGVLRTSLAVLLADGGSSRRCLCGSAKGGKT
jgi:hypothetical protein